MNSRAHPGWIGRHKAVFALLALSGILLGLVAGWAVYLNQQIASVPRIELNLDEDERPQRPTGSSADAVNILLAGADAGDADGPSIAESVAEGEWIPGSHRSDTIMVLHVTADRDHAYLVSVPRDSWVDIPGYGMEKINAAFSFGGPSLYVRTLEDFTGLRMDHLAIIDWEGFKDLTSALDGVEVYIPETVRDPNGGTVWEKGRHTVEGEEALRYVRQRHGLPGGDFDRIERQQNLLRSLMQKLVSAGTLVNPIKLSNALEAISGNLVVDDGFSTGDMRGLALSLRGLSTNDVTFVTVPVRGLDRIRGQSVVLVDENRTKGLFGAVMADELGLYLRNHEADLLGEPGTVS